MSPAPTGTNAPPLNYELRAALPRLERAPGRAALVLPPVARPLAVVVVVVSALCCALMAWVATLVWVRWLRAPTPATAAPLLPMVAGWSALAACTGVLFAGVCYWFAGPSRLPSVFEVAEGNLTMTTPGLLRAYTRRVPLARVRSVAAREQVAWRGAFVNLSIRRGRFTGYWRRFYVPRRHFAAEINDAFAIAIREQSQAR